MMKFLLALVLTILAFGAASAQTGVAAHIKFGSSLPASCSQVTGDVFIKNNVSPTEFYWCSAANTWTKLSGATVSSVGVSTNAGFLTVGSSPITTSGTITLNLTTGLSANQVLASPDGGPGTVSLRALVSNDVPSLDAAKITTGTFGTARIVAAPTNSRCLRLDGAGNIVVASGDCSTGGGSGTVTNTGALTANQLVIGNGSADISTLGSLGTTTTVLHGNAGGAPSFSAIVNADITNSTIDLTAKVTGILPVANGGTGANTLAANNVILGNTTSAVQFVAPGTSGNVLTSNGSTWTSAAASGGSVGSGNVNMTVANASSTGTTVNRLAKLTGAPSTAVITSTSDTENAVGVVTSGAGTTGSATIAIMGQVSCDFDGSTTAGNYVIISTTTGGKCHDGGSTFPTAGAAYGRVLSTNVGAGTYSMELMTPDIAFQNAGNGKSKPGGSNLDYQYNSSNTFAGGRLKQEATDIVSVDGGVSTPQTFKVYQNDNGGTTAYIALIGGTTHTIRSDGTDIKNLRIGTGTHYWEFGSGGVSFDADRQYNLGTSSSRINQANIYDTIVSNTMQMTDSSGPRFSVPSGSSWMHLTQGGTSNAIRLGFGDAGSNGSAIYYSGSGASLETVVASDTTTHRYWVTAGSQFTSAQFDKTTNTTLANVTGLVSEALIAGKTYAFNAELFVDADVTGGSKYAIAGTATATAIKYEVEMTCDATNLLVITSRQTALAGSVGQAGCTAGKTRITGTITVNAAGTLAVQFAQNASNGTSSVLTMSKFEVRQLN